MRGTPGQPSLLQRVREKIAQIEDGTVPTSPEEKRASFLGIGSIFSNSTTGAGGGTSVRFAAQINPDDFARAVVRSKEIWRGLGLDDAAIEESIADDSDITQAYVDGKTTMSIADLRSAVYPAVRRGPFERAPSRDEKFAWKIMMGLRRLVVDSSKISKTRRNVQRQTPEAKEKRRLREILARDSKLTAGLSDIQHVSEAVPDYLDNDDADFFAELDSRAEDLVANGSGPDPILETEKDTPAGDAFGLISVDDIFGSEDPDAAGPAGDAFGFEALDRVRSSADPDAAGPASAEPGFLDAYIKEYNRFPGL